jgi:glycosyltransferase involved in cell wall biosynthesis
LHIVFIAWRDRVHPRAGGSEALVDRLARHAVSRGHDVVLVCGGPIGDNPYVTVDAGGTWSQYARAPWIVLRRFRTADVVVDVENGVPFFSPLWRRRPSILLVHHVHRDQWPMHFGRGATLVGRLLEEVVMPRLYRRHPVFAISGTTRDDLVSIGFETERIRVIRPGVDLAGGADAHVDASEPTCLMLGRLVPHKRVDLAIRLWPRVRERVGGRLVIAGDGPELEKLRRTEVEGVNLLGRVSDEDRDRLLREAWLLVHPAHHEGWGMVILEAASAGTPALGFRVAGVREAIRDGSTGSVVPEGDDDAFVDRWIELASNHRLRRELGTNAHRRAAESTWSSTLDAFDQLLADAVAGRGARTS